MHSKAELSRADQEAVAMSAVATEEEEAEITVVEAVAVTTEEAVVAVTTVAQELVLVDREKIN